MRRVTCTLLAGVLTATIAGAQEDYDLANALLDRGWYDLAEELFTKIRNTSSLAEEKRAEGAYGLARIKVSQAERETDPQKKAAVYDGAIKIIQDFLRQYPKHQRRNEAYSDIGYLHQQKGKYLMSRAKTDATAVDQAEAAFKQAEDLFMELIANLKGDRPERPNEEDREKPDYGQRMERYEEWEQRMMFAKYNYGISLFAHAETYRDNSAKHEAMKGLLTKMVKFFQDDFMWEFEAYLMAYDAFIYMGRAYQLLAETGEPAKAEDHWKNCFNYIGKAKSLMEDKQSRMHEGVREVTVRATYYEMKAKLAYGDTKRGGSATRQYIDAAKLAETLFKNFPTAKKEEMGLIIRIEQGRAYCKGGRLVDGLKILDELKRENPETPIESLAIDIIGEYDETNLGRAIESADNHWEQGGTHYFSAISKYRRALSAIRKKEDEKLIPHCWYHIADSYFRLDRFWEAIAACSVLEKPQFKGASEAARAALLKLGCLGRIKKLTGTKADEDAYNSFLSWATREFPTEIGARGHMEEALNKEREAEIAIQNKKYSGEFLQAAQAWGRIAQSKDSPLYGQALFYVGLDTHRHASELLKGTDPAKEVGVLNQALEAFKKYLEWYDRLKTKEKDAVKYGLGSVHFCVSIYTHPRINKPAEALAVSKDLDSRFPGGDPIRLRKILLLRIRAMIDQNLIDEARTEFRALEELYRKDRLGVESYVEACVRVAQALEEHTAKLQETDKAKAESYSLESGDCYYKAYELNPSIFKEAELDAVAGKFFMIAEQKWEAARKTNDKKAEEEARKFYGQARDFYQEFRSKPGIKLTSEQVSLIQRRVTTCLLRTGNFDEALKEYDRLTADDPTMTRGSAWEGKADCYMEQARSMPLGAQRNELIRKADEIYSRLAGLLGQSNQNEHYWRLLYKHAETLFEEGSKWQTLEVFFKSMQARGYAPAWDNNTWGFQTKFEALKKQLETKLGGN